MYVDYYPAIWGIYLIDSMYRIDLWVGLAVCDHLWYSRWSDMASSRKVFHFP